MCLVDFCVCVSVRVSVSFDCSQPLSLLPTPQEYFAPEVIDTSYGPQADVWALGCVLFEILSGEQAFPVHNDDTESKVCVCDVCVQQTVIVGCCSRYAYVCMYVYSIVASK